MLYLKQSTAATAVLGPFVDDTDGKTAEVGLAIAQADIRLSKNGGAFAQTNNVAGATHMENGYYSVPLDGTDTATLGRLTVTVSESGALPVWREFLVVTANVYDTLCSTDQYDVNVTNVAGTAQTANDNGADINAILVDTGTTLDTALATVDGNVDAILVDTGTTLDAALAVVDANVDSILVDTAVIGALGAGLTGIPWNSAWDAEVESEATDALNAYDPPTDAEMDARTILAASYFDPTADAVANVTLVATTTTNTDMVAAAPSAATIADAVWDEVLTAAAHNVATSAGKRLRQLAGMVIHDGTCQAGSTVNTIVFDAGASASDGAYDPALVAIISGTGAGQSRLLYEYTGASRTAVVDRSWKTTPDATSAFIIYANPGREHVNEGMATGGTATTITLNALASSSNNAYIGQLVFIRSGTGDDQVRMVTAYNGGTKVATVDRAWDVTPTTSSGYAVLPNQLEDLPAILADTNELQTDDTPAAIAALNDISAADVNAQVLDVLNVDTFAELAGVPAATSTLVQRIGWLYLLARNKITQTSAVQTVLADDGSTTVATAAVSDDLTTGIRNEYT